MWVCDLVYLYVLTLWWTSPPWPCMDNGWMDGWMYCIARVLNHKQKLVSAFVAFLQILCWVCVPQSPDISAASHSPSLSQSVFTRVKGLRSLTHLCISPSCKVVQSRTAPQNWLDLFYVFHRDRIKVVLLKHGENSSSNLCAQIWPDTICSPQRSKVDPASMNYTLSDMWRVKGYLCM